MVRSTFNIVAVSLCLSACGEARDIPEQNLSEIVHTYESDTLELTVRTELVDSDLGLLVGMTKEDADDVLEAAGFINPILVEQSSEGPCEDRSQVYVRTKNGNDNNMERMHIRFDLEQNGEDCVPMLARTLHLKS